MKIGIVTDTHLAPPDPPPSGFQNPYDFANARARFKQALERHRNAGVDFLVHLGDLTNAEHAAVMAEGLDILAAAALPTVLVPGNHDVEAGVETYTARIAARAVQGLWMPFAEGYVRDGIRIAGLTAVDTGSPLAWRSQEPPVERWGDDPVLLLAHFPPFSRREGVTAAGLRYAGDVDNHERLAALLAARSAPTVVLHGHLHVRTALVRGPVLQIGFAAMIEPPYEPATLEIEGGDAPALTVVHHPEAVAGVRLPVMSPERSCWRFTGGSWTTLEG